MGTRKQVCANIYINKYHRHVGYINDSELLWMGLALDMDQKRKWHINKL